MTIKHLVFGGGGPFGIVALGALKYLHEQKFWNIKDIKTIYSTSIGAWLSVYLTLGYDYDYICEYLIKRPWDKLFKNIGVESLIDFYNERGLIELPSLAMGSFNIMLEAKGVSPNMTMKEYYEYCGIELNFITTEINNFRRVILSHKTHPDLALTTALSMTAAFPAIFRPIIIGDECYTDGGFFCNYPIDICLDETGCDPREVLGVQKKYNPDELLIGNDSTIVDYFVKIMNNLVNHIGDIKNLPHIPYNLECDMNIFNTYEEWVNVATSSESRAILIESGYDSAKLNCAHWIDNASIEVSTCTSKEIPGECDTNTDNDNDVEVSVENSTTITSISADPVGGGTGDS